MSRSSRPRAAVMIRRLRRSLSGTDAELRRMVGRFFTRPERVEEILQDVFTKVYFALTGYSSDRGLRSQRGFHV